MKKGIETPEYKTDEEVLEAAYQKALATETDKIQMEDFVKLYGEEKVAEHQKKVREMRAEFDLQDLQSDTVIEARKFGKILEAILIEQIELNEWFGAGVNTQQTTDYDDYCNGIDFLSEFRKEGMRNFLGFAVDATHGVAVIRNKLAKIRKELDQGELGQVHYFQSSDTSIMGSQRFIPKIVLALDKKHVLEVAKLWVTGQKKALSEHPIRHIFIQEIFTQLRAQLVYVEGSIANGHTELDQLKDIFSSQLQFLEQFIPEAARVPVDRSSDEGLNMIHTACDTMFVNRQSPRQAKTQEEKEAMELFLKNMEAEKRQKQERVARVQFLRNLEKRASAGDEEARSQLREINEVHLKKVA